MDLGRVDVVLVRPARAANVAAACRALKNMGLGSLALVGAPAGLDQPEARALAYGAWDVLDAAVPAALLRGGRLALVFGPEASGLTDEELAQCHLRVHIPTDPAHPSLNLAQAVLVVAYELRLAAVGA